MVAFNQRRSWLSVGDEGAVCVKDGAVYSVPARCRRFFIIHRSPWRLVRRHRSWLNGRGGAVSIRRRFEFLLSWQNSAMSVATPSTSQWKTAERLTRSSTRFRAARPPDETKLTWLVQLQMPSKSRKLRNAGCASDLFQFPVILAAIPRQRWAFTRFCLLCIELSDRVHVAFWVAALRFLCIF
jgi:hypothetical protein